jgi:hypothetical protein
MLFDGFPGIGLWLFLFIGAVALAVFLSLVIRCGSRCREHETYYKAETLRRITEPSAESAKAAMELLREEARHKLIARREHLKVAGLFMVAMALALAIFLRAAPGLGGVPGGEVAGPAYLSALILGFPGIAMLIYLYFLSKPVE